MLQKGQILHVLTILWDNLQESHPQLVPAEQIAEKMDMDFSALKPVLKVMKGMGVIEIDPDLHYTLITQKGLRWLSEYNPMQSSCYLDCMSEGGLVEEAIGGVSV
ncbi:hypothetical protein [Desulfogranum marinum]|jgi:predicted transcriptional regulator|uniref:hypothetical protein n=1 Tax=Desulfogranum marinum TaxID=453220 RepID=UPI0029C8A092|nr:hypothetical protein [Desulfogranum marinum]